MIKSGNASCYSRRCGKIVHTTWPALMPANGSASTATRRGDGRSSKQRLSMLRQRINHDRSGLSLVAVIALSSAAASELAA